MAREAPLHGRKELASVVEVAGVEQVLAAPRPQQRLDGRESVVHLRQSARRWSSALGAPDRFTLAEAKARLDLAPETGLAH